MGNIFRLAISAVIVTIIASFLLYTTAAAQSPSSQGITLSPTSTDLIIDPGSSVTRTVDIINTGTETFTATLSSSPYYVVGEKYDPHFTQLPGTVDASEWVKVSQPSKSVESNQTITVPYAVTVPSGTAPGGYYAVVFAETGSNAEKSGVTARSKVGNILYITVSGEMQTGGSLTGNTLPRLSFAGPLLISTKISNSGGTHFISNVTYAVTDFNGNSVYTANAERYILPQTEREISYEWTPKVLIGLFTVQRSATIAGELTKLPNEKVFIINPWFLVASTFLIGLMIGIPVQRERRRRRQRRQ